MFPAQNDSEKPEGEWLLLLRSTRTRAEWDAIVARIIAVHNNLPEWWYMHVQPKNLFAKQQMVWDKIEREG